MRVAIDATPAVRQQAGVGRYTRELLRALVTAPEAHEYLLLTAGPDADARRVWSELPPGHWRENRRLPVSDRTLTAAWQRLRLPLTVERLIGAFDLFHGPDFVLPPTQAATTVTVHDLSFLVAPEFSDPRLVRYLTEALPRSLRRADSVIAVSATVAGQLAEWFPAVQDRLFAVPNGVIPPPSLERTIPPRPLVLMVGTIEPRKDHHTLLKAMELVWAERPDTDLIVLGRPGWLADDIVTAITAAAERRPLRWLNDADDAELERCYAAATVAVYPARYEGFGLPVIEAMARGVPMVASDAPALVEVSGGHACHVPIGDAAAFAASIIRFIDDAALRARFTDAALDWSMRFTWSNTAAGTLRAYAAAVARRSA